MKILFLDFDGVLNSEQSMRASYRATHKGGLNKDMDPVLCSNLIEILDEVPDCRIVVSSSWRIGTPLPRLQNILEEMGIPRDRVIDATPVGRRADEQRGHEIQRWLDAHPEVGKFVIVDDSSDMAHLMPELVRTNTRIGLTVMDAEEIIRRFDPRSPCIDCGEEGKGARPFVCGACMRAKLKTKQEESRKDAKEER